MKHDELYDIIGAAMEVHKILGPGLLEKAYGDALAIELQLRNIPFEREKALPVIYKEHQLATCYYADFFCYNSIVVELKAVSKILPIHTAQTIHYMLITNTEKGLLLNFGEESLYYDKQFLKPCL